MFSLALIVSLLFLLVLCLGPICLILASLKWTPSWIIIILGVVSVLVGFWWFLLPISIIRFIGLIDVVCGLYSVFCALDRKTEKTQG